MSTTPHDSISASSAERYRSGSYGLSLADLLIAVVLAPIVRIARALKK